MAYKANEDSIHRDLDDIEEKVFRKWARDNFKPAVEEISSLNGYHHVVIDEAIQMDLEWRNPNNH